MSGFISGLLQGFGPSQRSTPSLPDSTALLTASDRLLYSSSVVEQAYPHLIGSHEPANAPERYRDLAVLQERTEGVGVEPLDDHLTDDGELGEIEMEPPEGVGPDHVPTVFKTTGTLTVSSESDTAEWGEMFLNEVTTGDRTLTGYGSPENYHPLIRGHVTAGNRFELPEVEAYLMLPGERQFSDGDVHFMQIALPEERGGEA